MVDISAKLVESSCDITDCCVIIGVVQCIRCVCENHYLEGSRLPICKV